MKLRSLLRPVLGRERAVWRLLPWPGLRLRFFHDGIDCVIFSLLVSQRRVFFIQIGSHDGRAGDPLWTFRRYRNWRGILVEPVDYLFHRLVQNYSPWRQRFTFENAAIAGEGGARTFHYLAQNDELAEGYDQLGSFDRELLLRHTQYFPGAETRVVSGWVNCLTWRELCEKHHAKEIDLLHIDAEGSDREILEQVDLTRYQPRVLLYEHIHMAAAEQRETAERLDRAGYEFVRIGIDTLAVRSSALTTMPALARAWQLITLK